MCKDREVAETKHEEELTEEVLEKVSGGGFKNWVKGLFDEPDQMKNS